MGAARKPACRDQPGFTADWISPTDRETYAGVCATCPLLLPCRRTVEADPPPVGYWAGTYYGPANRPRTLKAAA